MAVDVVVVGGGLIGCSVAYYLLKQGASVALLEREHLGAGASGAAAGMLAAQVECGAPDAFYDLCLRSRERYAPFVAELLAETGIDAELVQRGILQPAHSAERAAALQARAEWQRGRGQRAEWLDAAAARRLAPGLAEPLLGALYLPDDAQVQPPRLVSALRAAIVQRGGVIAEGTAVTGWLGSAERVTGVRSSNGDHLAGDVVLAAGVHSGPMAAWANVQAPVHPVKGQIIAVQAPAYMARPTLFGHAFYAVPKRDGRLLLGATEEPAAGFDQRPTLGGLSQLASAATAGLPELAGLPLVAHWAGLRPATPDHRPLLGRVRAGLVLATGHFRNGVVLAPLTGEAIAAVVAGATPPELAPFSPGRFAAL